MQPEPEPEPIETVETGRNLNLNTMLAPTTKVKSTSVDKTNPGSVSCPNPGSVSGPNTGQMKPQMMNSLPTPVSHNVRYTTYTPSRFQAPGYTTLTPRHIPPSTTSTPSLKRARPVAGESNISPDVKRKQFIEDIRSVKKALVVLMEKWHAWEESLL